MRGEQCADRHGALTLVADPQPPPRVCEDTGTEQGFRTLRRHVVEREALDGDATPVGEAALVPDALEAETGGRFGQPSAGCAEQQGWVTLEVPSSLPEVGCRPQAP